MTENSSAPSPVVGARPSAGGFSLLCDREIEDLAYHGGMIDPFVGHQVREVSVGRGYPSLTALADATTQHVISYGLSSYGYDVRLGNQFGVFVARAGRHSGLAIDPKDFDPAAMDQIEVADHDALVIPPGTYALGHSAERFHLPEDVTGICVGKSTYARCGIIVNVTPLEPGWRGYITIEISNATPLPVKVYAGEGVMQVLFYRGAPCRVSYATRAGKYQDQTREVTNARL